jgi:hypothetical protein
MRRIAECSRAAAAVVNDAPTFAVAVALLVGLPGAGVAATVAGAALEAAGVLDWTAAVVPAVVLADIAGSGGAALAAAPPTTATVDAAATALLIDTALTVVPLPSVVLSR